MEVYFAQNTRTLPGIYDGYDDVPGLSLRLHLHTWSFPDEAGEARFRIEIWEGEAGMDRRPLAAGFVTATPDQVVEVKATAPLGQALLDGMLTHKALRDFFAQSAHDALKSAQSQKPEEEEKLRIPLSAIRKSRS